MHGISSGNGAVMAECHYHIEYIRLDLAGIQQIIVCNYSCVFDTIGKPYTYIWHSTLIRVIQFISVQFSMGICFHPFFCSYTNVL